MIKILQNIADVNRITKVPLRNWQIIIVHHTVTDADVNKLYGEKQDAKHRTERGFRQGLGYHFLINPNGIIEYGDRWENQLDGAHCVSKTHSWNSMAIGVAFVGNFSIPGSRPTARQLMAWNELQKQLMPRSIYPHCAFEPTECPGAQWDLRNWYGAIIGVPEGKLITGG